MGPMGSLMALSAAIVVVLVAAVVALHVWRRRAVQA